MDTVRESNNDGVAGGQHSVARTVVLHLLPGVLVTAFYVVVAPVVGSLGFPPLMAIFLGILFVLIPFELGYLLSTRGQCGPLRGDLRLFREPQATEKGCKGVGKFGRGGPGGVTALSRRGSPRTTWFSRLRGSPSRV
jgi:hypothetical protein